jgi:branched-chain amino acid transport system ATP-binding protein
MELLKANGVSMHFGGVQAVVDLSLTVEEGQIFGIIGPNGSGKTTFFNVLTGIYRPTGGTFTFKGQDITAWPPHRIASHGIARTFQNIRLFRNTSVLDNVLVGGHCHVGATLWDVLLQSRAKHEAEAKARKRSEELLRFVGLEGKAGEFAANLAYGEQRRVELARALGNQPDLLLLDEPTAGMSDSEAREIMELIREIRQMGVTILLIEHNMKVMMGTAEWIVALDAGHKIAEGPPREIQYNEKVIQAYLGEEE